MITFDSGGLGVQQPFDLREECSWTGLARGEILEQAHAQKLKLGGLKAVAAPELINLIRSHCKLTGKDLLELLALLRVRSTTVKVRHDGTNEEQRDTKEPVRLLFISTGHTTLPLLLRLFRRLLWRLRHVHGGRGSGAQGARSGEGAPTTTENRYARKLGVGEDAAERDAATTEERTCSADETRHGAHGHVKAKARRIRTRHQGGQRSDSTTQGRTATLNEAQDTASGPGLERN
mmetsp:Transcript_16792/g.32729  ORF Transcript_16792/g.32729 Transcript_16792/m.32729 type:complete len:234 (+) Transcript_16792:937-1638(+)